jgi:hypothetical protein
MPSPDPTFDAMLRTPECKEIWQNVWSLRCRWECPSLHFDSDKDADPGWPRCDHDGCIGKPLASPHLDEVWTLAKAKAFRAGYVGIRLASYEGGGVLVDRLGSEGWEDFPPGEVASEETGVLAYLVGRPWKEGGWK